jgi:hypothetical protein
MITQKVNKEGLMEYHEDGYWLEMPGDPPRNSPSLYHHCPRGRDCDILLEEETRDMKCYQCGDVSIPDGLWTLYVLLEGRGVM